MSLGNNELVNAAVMRSYALIDYNIYNDIHKRHEFKKRIILADESLTENEKSEAIEIITKCYDDEKIRQNEGTKRICENCNQECLATTYCELCVRNYLRANFSNWTSGNDNIDNLIQECQMKTVAPRLIPEWIPYNNFKNTKFLAKGGCSVIYTASWNDGHFIEWDSKKRQLERFGNQAIVLKRLENVNNANQRWFGEPPFFNCEHNYDLAKNIVNGIRPKIVPGTPLEYKNLVMKCWDTDPSKRPNIGTLWVNMSRIRLNYYQESETNDQPEENNNVLKINRNIKSLKNYISTSKVYQFENLPEPRNATEEEIEAFYSKSFDLYIPDNVK
ncbi:kinase-like domain-containing protein [Rhizophagus clarus]|uniref:Kinase-like domain-containing protein n=1 Tax=Rhizophagus clarus TaxID=94130 RepID=A0A8H3KXX9_9GLOM|nr:kinase-like domain-containing protein [Rhizophagus clarus]